MLNTLNSTRAAIPRRVLATIAYGLIALTMVLALMQYATGGRVAYTMDSLSHRDAALNFIAGHSMQATNVMKHDTATIFDLFEHSLFAFSYMIQANLELPLTAAVILLVITALRRHGVQWLRPPEIWLPIVWLS